MTDVDCPKCGSKEIVQNIHDKWYRCFVCRFYWMEGKIRNETTY